MQHRSCMPRYQRQTIGDQWKTASHSPFISTSVNAADIGYAYRQPKRACELMRIARHGLDKAPADERDAPIRFRPASRPRSPESESGDPYGIRTRVAAVKGRCPRPLDEGVVGGRRYKPVTGKSSPKNTSGNLRQRTGRPRVFRERPATGADHSRPRSGVPIQVTAIGPPAEPVAPLIGVGAKM